MEELIKRVKSVGWEQKSELYQGVFKSYFYKENNNKVIISIVIISNNYNDLILENLKRIEKHTNVQYQVIFVNNGIENLYSDELKSLVDTYIELKYNTGAYLARNIGALFSSAKYTIFLEDDGIIDEDLVNSYVQIYKCFEIDFVRGGCLPRTNNPCNYRQNHYFLGGEFCPSYIDLEGNCCIKTSLFYKVGGWDDDIFFGGGGPDLSLRLLELNGDLARQIYSPISIIYHDYAKNDEHLKVKREKQFNSRQRLRLKHAQFEDKLLNWSLLLGNFAPIKINKHSNFTDFERLEKIKKRVRKRNIINFEKKYNLYNQIDLDMMLDILNKNSTDIYIFGAGSFGESIYLKLMSLNIEIKGFIDNDNKKFYKYLSRLKIMPYKDVDKKALIIIASTWDYEIREQLIISKHEGVILNLKAI